MKNNLINGIVISSLQEAEDIIKSAGTEDLFEKAKWNVGDEKVYQGVTYVVGGFNAKGTPLWRKKKDGGGSGDNKQQNLKTNTTPAADKKPTAVEKKKEDGGSGNVVSSPNNSKKNIKIDETSLDDSEYKRQYKRAMSFSNSSLMVERRMIQININSTKKDLQDVIQKRPNSKATILKLQKELTTYLSQKKAVDDVIKEIEKKKKSAVAEKKTPEVQKKTPATQKKIVDKIASKLGNSFESVILAISPFINKVLISNDKGDITKTHKIDDWEKGVIKVGNDYVGKSDIIELDTKDADITLRKYTSNGRGAYNNKPVGDVIVEVLKNNNWTEYNMTKESDRKAFADLFSKK